MQNVMEEIPSPVYGEKNITVRYRVCDLSWPPIGLKVRFVISCTFLMPADTSLSAADIIRLYRLRFKIEHVFKQAPSSF